MTTDKRFSLKRLLRCLAAFAVGINVSFIYIQWQSSIPQTAYDYYQLGKKWELGGQYDRAEVALTKSLKMDPRFGKAYLMMGVLQNEKANYASAIVYFQKSIEFLKGSDKANEAIAYYDLGHAYEQLGDGANAWTYFREAYARQSYMSPHLWPDKAQKNVYYVIHNDEQGFKERLRSQSDRLPEAVQRRINRYRSEGSAGKYVKDAQQYLADNPGSPYADEFRKFLVSGLLYKGRAQEALEHIQQLNAARLSDNDWAWLKYMRALAHKDLHQYDLALNDLDDLLYGDNRYYSQDILLHEKSLVFKAKGDKGAEEQALLQLLQRKDGEDSYKYYEHYRLSEIYLYSGKYKKSFQHYFPHGDFRLLWFPLIFAVVAAGAVLFVFFLIHRVFFGSRREEVKGSPFRLWHLYSFMVVSSVVPLILFHGFMAYDYYVLDVFSRFQLNPFLISLFVSDIIFVWLALYLLGQKCGLDSKTLGFYSRGPKFDFALPVVLAVALGAATLGYSFLLERFGVKDIPQGYGEEVISNIVSGRDMGQIILLIVLVVVITPIVEEVIFRVFAFQYIRRYTNPWTAVILSSLLFASGHGEWMHVPFYFLIGCVLAMAYVKTRTIYPSMIVHGLNNLFSFYFNCWK